MNKAILSISALLIGVTSNYVGASTEPVQEAAGRQILNTHSLLPLRFIRNDGQLNERVAYYVREKDHSVYFTDEGIYISLAKRSETEAGTGSVRSTTAESAPPDHA